MRLSNEEAQGGESSSITNQRMIVQNYCKQNNITLVREFVDDGYSGGNFNRPGFKEMLKQLEQSRANLVITKDLSRLGRDMREASYYNEQFFPEHGIQYIAIADNFDTEHDNIIALFLFFASRTAPARSRTCCGASGGAANTAPARPTVTARAGQKPSPLLCFWI
ncbi:recombinase family protein [Colidextribacter sp. OB.20]|uniref:recombinase family protein n=1 Tax=Colidextribacter sp. OB.20 TaxID=2304568 RepID=UPI0024335D44|nr:recombinase family protein [Colidextribacter sp. OB.20]